VKALARALALAAFAALPSGSAAAAEDVRLRPRFRPGDLYGLSLRVSTITDGVASGEGGESVHENIRLQYEASVMVLEVDADAQPVREQHEDVTLTYERPGESGSLFKPGVSYEVRRREGIEVFLAGRRAEAKIEKTVTDVLARQFAFTLEPALLEPGRPVAVGESWEPDPSLVKRFLWSRGVQVQSVGGGAVATLLREPGESGLVIEYAIPLTRFVLREMPERAEAARTSGRLEGRVRLGAGAAVTSFSSLTLDMAGVLTGAAQPMPWTLRSAVIVEQAPPGRFALPASAR
jgi:hypothetical protein